ncbi:MAG: hypothetical protein IJY69_02255 [Clostridia bacterium]|nr:hypothetical protein [Clostridia bacterium]
MPDGTNFAYKNKNDAEPTGSGITLNKKSKGSDIGSASNIIIPDSAKKINTSDEKSSEKIFEGRSSLSDTEQREELARAFEGLAKTDGEKLSDKQLNIRGKI